MDDVLPGAAERIERYRKRGLVVRVLRDGKPVTGGRVRLRMQQHQFLFGCNAFGAVDPRTYEVDQAYTAQFTRALNYATLPFYWMTYESERGRTRHDYLGRLVRWCADNGLVAKGHPLVWDHTCPQWVTDSDPLPALVAERNRQIMERFGDTVLWWDVINEVLGSDRFDNPMSRWFREIGPAEAVRYAVETARAAHPKANLIVNDYNVDRQKYHEIFARLADQGVEIQAFGIQSHMHATRWTLDRAWSVCEEFSRYGWPLHFTELSVLSGRPAREIDWFDSSKNEWLVADADYEDQAAYVSDFYTLLFSHPAVEAISWWDLVDGKWLKAPSGLVREDLSPKPAYEALVRLVRKEWWTDAEGTTDAHGIYRARGFCGRYLVEVEAGGRAIAVEVDLPRERHVYRNHEVVIRL